MLQEEFINLIKEKAGIDIQLKDMNEDLVNIENWDSLAFVYMILALEKEKKSVFDVQKFLTAKKLYDVYEMMNHEVNQSKQ